MADNDYDDEYQFTDLENNPSTPSDNASTSSQKQFMAERNHIFRNALVAIVVLALLFFLYKFTSPFFLNKKQSALNSGSSISSFQNTSSNSANPSQENQSSASPSQATPAVNETANTESSATVAMPQSVPNAEPSSTSPTSSAQDTSQPQSALNPASQLNTSAQAPSTQPAGLNSQENQSSTGTEASSNQLASGNNNAVLLTPQQGNTAAQTPSINLASTTDLVPDAIKDVRQNVAVLELTEQSLREEVALMHHEMTELSNQIAQITTKLTDLSQSVAILSGKLNQQSQTTLLVPPPMLVKHPIVKKVRRRTKASGPTYYIQAVIPGRAWLVTRNGSTLTVSEGASLRGYGIIKLIDPNQGRILTSSGRIIRFSQQDS